MQHPTHALRLFRGLLWLYPTEFRDHFSHEICLAFEDRWRERPGALSMASMYLSVLRDAPREHLLMIRQDLIYAWRTMCRERLSSLVGVLVLALGIGSTATVFTLVNAMLLRPLPYPAQDRLVYVEESSKEQQGINGAMAFPNYLDMRARNRTLQDIAMFSNGLATLRGDFAAERVPAAFVTEPVFRVLGVQPLMGRTFTPEEDRLNGPNSVILGEDLWRRRYGADPNILGKTIVVGSDPHTIIGVMPRGFHFPNIAQMWLTAQMDVKNNKRTDHGYEGIARLRPGFTIVQAQDDLRGIMRQIIEENPTETYHQTVDISPYRSRDTRRVQPVLWALMGAVGFVLLIACANITNLLLVKSAARRKEIAVRTAMGASRPRLVRQFLVESGLLAGFGAIGGIGLSLVAVPALLALVPPNTMPLWIHFTPDARTLAFVTLIACAAAVAAGLAPAISVSRPNIVESLKEGGRANTSSRARSWVRASLVVAEMAASVILLAGAGMMIRTFLNLNRMNPGYDPDHVYTLQTAAPGSRYNSRERDVQLARQILAEFRAIPGVVAAAGASGVPILDAWGRSLTVEGRPVLSLQDAPLINHTVITTGYFQALHIPILQGRDFTEADGRDPLVTIVDAGIARKYWPHENPIGKRVRFGPPEYNEPWHTVVGVVGEARNQSLRTLRRQSVYLPNAEFSFASLAYIVRASPGVTDPTPALRARIAAVDRSIAVSRAIALRDAIDQSIWQERFFATLLAGFGALALLMAVIGLYGVLAYTVSQRTHEMGIRMALGASARQIRAMVLLHSGKLAAGGLALGAMGALLLTRLLETQLYDVKPGDPGTVAGVAALLGAAAMAASYVPACRATRVDPMVALREE